MFWKYGANFQENTPADVWFQQSFFVTLLKSYLGMAVVLLQISCIFSEHLFNRTSLGGCFWTLNMSLRFKDLFSMICLKRVQNKEWEICLCLNNATKPIIVKRMKRAKTMYTYHCIYLSAYCKYNPYHKHIYSFRTSLNIFDRTHHYYFDIH